MANHSVRTLTSMCALILMLSSACSTGHQEKASPEIVNTLITLVDPPTSLAVAKEIKIRECLGAHGFRVSKGTLGNNTPTQTSMGVKGLFYSEEQAQNGYSSTIKDDTDIKFGIDMRTISKKTQDKIQTVLYGPDDAPMVTVTAENGRIVSTSTVGCNAEAGKAIHGSLENELALENAESELLSVITSTLDARHGSLIGPIAKYGSCMAQAGHIIIGFKPYEYAEATFGQYRKAGEPPSPKERSLALTDYTCQRSSGVYQTTLDHFAQSMYQWSIENQAKIASLRELQQKALANAKRIIDGE